MMTYQPDSKTKQFAAVPSYFCVLRIPFLALDMAFPPDIVPPLIRFMEADPCSTLL